MPKGVYLRTERHRAILSQNSKGKTGRKHALETRRKMSASAKKGANHHWWQGGKTEMTRNLRNSSEYKIWRQAVYERDHYQCVLCGGGRSGSSLEADHIKPVCKFPELVFDVDNGQTLCKSCHRKRTKIQLLNQWS